ncbi:Retrovirus-related Pol polyprotein from transposon TNT 1-94 [Linum perenne]
MSGFVGYIDADYGGDLDNRRPLTGFVFTIGGCAVSWKASLQRYPALSTIKAEYTIICEACKQIV